MPHMQMASLFKPLWHRSVTATLHTATHQRLIFQLPNMAMRAASALLLRPVFFFSVVLCRSGAGASSLGEGSFTLLLLAAATMGAAAVSGSLLPRALSFFAPRALSFFAPRALPLGLLIGCAARGLALTLLSFFDGALARA